MREKGIEKKVGLWGGTQGEVGEERERDGEKTSTSRQWRDSKRQLALKEEPHLPSPFFFLALSPFSSFPFPPTLNSSLKINTTLLQSSIHTHTHNTPLHSHFFPLFSRFVLLRFSCFDWIPEMYSQKKISRQIVSAVEKFLLSIRPFYDFIFRKPFYDFIWLISLSLQVFTSNSALALFLCRQLHEVLLLSFFFFFNFLLT